MAAHESAQQNACNVDDIYREITAAGYSIEAIVSGDIEPPPEIRRRTDMLIAMDRSFYSALVARVSSLQLEEHAARNLWAEIVKHKYMMSEKLGRNVGIAVATVDYLGNIKRLITTPRIIKEEEFLRTIKLATRDALTGLYNRNHVFEWIRRHMRQGKRLALAFLDLDGFKRYNDTEGHQAGDLVLQEFAFLLTHEFAGRGDIVGRFGGDEFIVCALDTDKKTMQERCDAFRLKVVDQFRATTGITVSIGVAEYPYDARDLEELVARADELLYRVKEHHGNKVYRLRTIWFSYAPPKTMQPREVSVVGDFNNWDRKQGTMQRDETSGRWIRRMLLKPGDYKYKFLVDTNIWVADPVSDRQVDDGFGGVCSILKVNER
jgi:diguanylate cyclase (GGDEF)-like protein